MKMSNIVTAMVLVLAFFVHDVNAQEKKKNGIVKSVEKGAKAVGNKTAEVAVKGSAKVADQTYKGKMAPDGSNVYIDGKNRKYYVNKKGAKIYLKAAEIKDRPVH